MLKIYIWKGTYLVFFCFKKHHLLLSSSPVDGVRQGLISAAAVFHGSSNSSRSRKCLKTKCSGVFRFFILNLTFFLQENKEKTKKHHGRTRAALPAHGRTQAALPLQKHNRRAEQHSHGCSTSGFGISRSTSGQQQYRSSSTSWQQQQQQQQQKIKKKKKCSGVFSNFYWILPVHFSCRKTKKKSRRTTACTQAALPAQKQNQRWAALPWL